MVSLRPLGPANGSREARIARGEKVRPLKPAPVPAPPEAPSTAPLTYRAITAHLRKAYELLVDGEWHEREPILAAMVEAVDPDIALAVAERRQRDSAARGTTGERRRSRTDRAYLVAAGSKVIAASALAGAQRIERRTVDGTVMLRLRAPRYKRDTQT